MIEIESSDEEEYLGNRNSIEKLNKEVMIVDLSSDSD